MTFEEALEILNGPIYEPVATGSVEDALREHQELTKYTEALDLAQEAMTFAMALHSMFKDTGMTTTEQPDLNELENLVDALHGEIAAAVLFLCAGHFNRVPDMLKLISKNLENKPVDTVVIKGFERLATRIENTRQNLQNMVTTVNTAGDL